MLNAGYNLPSEDCNIEKQMVFHSNKLPCVCTVYIELGFSEPFCLCRAALNQITEQSRRAKGVLVWSGGENFVE